MKDERGLDRRIFSEQISLLFRQYTVPAVTASLVALIIVATLRDQIPLDILIGWFLLQNTCLLIGHIVVFRYKTSFEKEGVPDTWLKIHLATLSLIGFLWGGMTCFLFYKLPILSQIFILMVSLGAAASALVLAIPLLRAYFIFLTLTLAPPLVWLIGQYPNDISVLGGLGILFYLLLAFAGKNLNQQLVRTIRLRFENEHLADQVNLLNTNLESMVKEKTNALFESEQRFNLAMQGANDGLWDWNIDNNEAYFSPRWKSMLGYEESEIGKTAREWRSRLHPDDVRKVLTVMRNHLNGKTGGYESIHRIRHKDGHYLWVLDRARAVRTDDGHPYRMVGTQVDISDQKKLEEKFRAANLKLKHEAKERQIAQKELAHLAKHDPLTNLPNRILFYEQLQDAIRRAEFEGESIAVLLVDLDNFKHVNDTMGHPVGDRLLTDVSGRLTSIVNKNYFLSRFGGDEFLVILEGCSDTFLVDAYAREIIDLLSQPFYLDGQEIRIGCSIGITLFPDHGKEPDKLIRDADIAMYHAKDQGKNNFKFFSDELDREINERVTLKNMLHIALDKEELEIHYQPQVSLETGKVTGLEALLRWNPEENGYVSPEKFVPLLEETGLISKVGFWVLSESCSRVANLHARGKSDLKIAVNISPRQFLDNDLVSDIEKILEEAGLAPEYLEIEITENIFMEDLDLINNTLTRLKHLGVSVTLDDFGTGYSSLGYLKRFPIDGIKIDKVFVQDLHKNNDNRELVTAIIAMFQGLKMKTLVAEGVENEAQMKILRDAGCPTYQGYLFSQALPYEALEKLLFPVRRIKSV